MKNNPRGNGEERPLKAQMIPNAEIGYTPFPNQESAIYSLQWAHAPDAAADAVEMGCEREAGAATGTSGRFSSGRYGRYSGTAF